MGRGGAGAALMIVRESHMRERESPRGGRRDVGGSGQRVTLSAGWDLDGLSDEI